MNTKLLKQKILDLAIRGKLTQQLKSDGTAKDLLKQISEQKRESSSTLSSPRRRGSPSAQSEKTIIPLDKSEAPFEIPANWEWVRLNDIFNFIDYRGMTPEKVDKGVPLITAKNVKKGYIDFSIDEYISEESYAARQGRGSPQKGDILFTTEAPLGNVALAGIDKYSPGQRIITFQQYTKEKLLDNRFFVFFFLSDLFQNLLVDQKTGTTVTGIKAAKLKMIPVLLPPLAEQQRIVKKIQEAFTEIDSIENNKELLKTHIKQARQKILDLAIHGKLVPQNKADEPASVLLERITRDNPHYEKIEDGPFEIPENWVWCKLGDLSESIQYGYNAPAKDSGRIKMVRISDIHENEVEWDSVPYCDIDEKEIQTYLLKKNDILFARTGGTVGKSFIVSNLPEDAVYAGYLIRTRYGKNANAQYMKYFMESNLYWEQLRDGCIATAQPNCNGKTLGKMQIPLPPLNEQSRIVAKIEELFTELDLILQNT